jgi:hypothetical protein
VELLDMVFGALCLQQALPRKGRHVLLHHHDRARHALVLHPLRVVLAAARAGVRAATRQAGERERGRERRGVATGAQCAVAAAPLRANAP